MVFLPVRGTSLRYLNNCSDILVLFAVGPDVVTCTDDGREFVLDDILTTKELFAAKAAARAPLSEPSTTPSTPPSTAISPRASCSTSCAAASPTKKPAANSTSPSTGAATASSTNTTPTPDNFVGIHSRPTSNPTRSTPDERGPLVAQSQSWRRKIKYNPPERTTMSPVEATTPQVSPDPG